MIMRGKGEARGPKSMRGIGKRIGAGRRLGAGNVAGRAALVISVIALISSMTGAAGAARHAVARLVDGHQVTTKARAGAIPVLGKHGKLATAMIPSSSLSVAKVGGRTRKQLTLSCPSGTANLGTWCLMKSIYPLTAAEQQQGVNDYAWASQACTDLGGFLPSATQLIGAADKVRLESIYTDNPSTSIVDYDDDDDTVSVAVDQREMSSTLITTQAGSDAAGSEGVSAGSTTGTLGQPAPLAQPAVPFPPTLQYVTVYDNHNQGGFAGSEPVSTPENFRCGFDLRQG
jgi:hypothetical protein